MPQIVFGPILQFRGLNAGTWLVSALFATPAAEDAPQATFAEGNADIPAQPALLATLPLEAKRPSHRLWRVDFPVTLGAARAVTYRIGEHSGAFQVPAAGEMPRLAYGSCNGFSEKKLMKEVADHHERWAHLGRTHAQSHFSLLILGGDQVYSDSLWVEVESLRDWSELAGQARWKARWTATMARELDDFFSRLYLKHWQGPAMRAVLGSIPTIMMWDDHDIIDGWGSHPAERHDSDVYQGIFATARRYFRLFQLQCAEDEAHPAAVGGTDGHHLGFADLGGLALLVPDLRAERQPGIPGQPGAPGRPEQIVSADSWKRLYAWLDGLTTPRHLFLISSIPVAYLDLRILEKALKLLPGQQTLEDDLRDHWRSEPHWQERQRLIHRLLDFARDKHCRVTIVSGDVHVGALGVIESTREQGPHNAAIINQLVSTGIVHPAPPALARYVLESIADRVETVEYGITATMQPISGRGNYLIGARNWLALEPDAPGANGQARIWANWHVEGMDSPLTKVIHPVPLPPQAHA